MTKEERLYELKILDEFEKALNRDFNRRWRQYVREIHNKNDISNIRTFKILRELKGIGFVDDLMSLMEEVKLPHAYIEFTRKPKGVLLKDNRYTTIPELMIDKFPSGSYREGKIYIQVKADRWIMFTF